MFIRLRKFDLWDWNAENLFDLANDCGMDVSLRDRKLSLELWGEG